MSTISMTVVPSTENVSSLILMNPSDVEMDSFTTLPIDFESSNSSMGTMASVDESLKDDSIPMLTDIAEETVYDTEFFEETLKEEKSDSPEFHGDNHILSSGVEDIPGVLIDTPIMECEDTVKSNAIKIEDSDIDFHTESICVDKNSDLAFVPTNNGILVSTAAPSPSISEVSNSIKISKNTNLAAGILEISQDDSASDSRVEIVSGSSTVLTSMPNVIQMGSANNSKLSTYKPFTLQSNAKFVPISIAPNPAKRPANISIEQASSNVCIFYEFYRKYLIFK